MHPLADVELQGIHLRRDTICHNGFRPLKPRPSGGGHSGPMVRDLRCSRAASRKCKRYCAGRRQACPPEQSSVRRAGPASGRSLPRVLGHGAGGIHARWAAAPAGAPRTTGICLTRDSWNTTVVTQKRPECPPPEGRGFRGLKPLWHMVSRLKWICDTRSQG